MLGGKRAFCLKEVTERGHEGRKRLSDVKVALVNGSLQRIIPSSSPARVKSWEGGAKGALGKDAVIGQRLFLAGKAPGGNRRVT